jgi:rhamnose utilization protein RhaD (predicted bifunctional aldolase and dehydrogenase)
LSYGYAIDHPDPELGEQLMADTLGVADRDAMHGILRQLVKASVQDERPDEVNLAFMISTVKSIKPRDSVEAMLVAQMVSVHLMAMRCDAPITSQMRKTSLSKTVPGGH